MKQISAKASSFEYLKKELEELRQLEEEKMSLIQNMKADALLSTIKSKDIQDLKEGQPIDFEDLATKILSVEQALISESTGASLEVVEVASIKN